MSHSQQTYHTVFRRLAQSQPQERITRTRNLALLVTGLYLVGSCHLTRLATRLPLVGSHDSRVQRLRRLLLNERLSVVDSYAATLQDILHYLGQRRIILIVDRTALGDRLNVLTVSVAYRGRALPLAWEVLRGPGAVPHAEVIALLRRVRQESSLTSDPRQIWVVADREFQDVGLQASVEKELGWNYVQRITHHLWLYPLQGEPFQPGQLALAPDQAVSVPQVLVTRQQAGPAHFLAYWKKGTDEPWYLLSNQPGGRELLRVYDHRSWTEPMYRDFKSYGWDLEASRITDPGRLKRLLLGIALAYVWLIQLASQVIKAGERWRVDRTARRTWSYFRIGWNWLWYRLDHDRSLVLSPTLYP